jgi:hypothetical protein
MCCQNVITLIGVVDSLSSVIRDVNNELQCKEDVLGRLGTLKKELLETKLREASVTLQAERTLEAAIAGIYPAFARNPEIQVFITCLQRTLMAEVLPPPLPSCSLSRKSVA